MASKGGIKAGRAYVELGVNDAFTRGLNKAKAQLASFGAGITKIGVGLTAASAAAVAPIAAAVLKFSDQGDNIAKAAKRIGIGGEALQGLGHAAELSGADLETLEGGLRKMAKTVQDARDGSKSATEALDKLGLSVADLQGKSPDEQFKLIADRMKAIADPTLKTATAMEVFGKSGTQLIPLLDEGAAGISKLQAEFKALGAELSSSELAQAELLNDRLGDLKTAAGGVANHLAAALAPAISAVSKRVTEIIAETSRWIAQHQAAVVAVTKIILTVGAAGVAFVTLGTSITALSFVVGGFVSAFAAVAVVCKAAVAALAFLVTPIGAITAALVVGGGALLYYSGVAGKMVDFIKAKFSELIGFVSPIIQGISDALAAGDLGLASDVLWAGVKVAWEAGTAKLREIWEGTKTAVIKIAVDMWAGIVGKMADAVRIIERTWINTTSFWKQTLNTFSHFFKSIWLRLKSFMRRIANDIRGVFDPTFDSAKANLKELEDLAQKRLKNKEGWKKKRGEIETDRLNAQETSAKTARTTKETLAGVAAGVVDEQKKAGQERVAAAKKELAEANTALGKLQAAAKLTKAWAAIQKGGWTDIITGSGKKQTAAEAIKSSREATASSLQSVGGFALKALASQFGDNTQERTARGVEKMVQSNDKIQRNTDKWIRIMLNGGTFS